MDAQVQEQIEGLLDLQQGVIGRWQMLAAGASLAEVRWAASKMRGLRSGVYTVGRGTTTTEQRRWSAVVSAPGTVLSHRSAATAWGIGELRPEQFLTVTRPGRGARTRFGDLLVSYRHDLDGSVGTLAGLPVTTPGRTIVDLAPFLDDDALGRIVRDALRLKRADAVALASAIETARGRKGIRRLRAIAAKYAVEHATRTRSDAEVLALALIVMDRLPAPQVNVVCAGHEADLTWPDRRLLVELDGGSFHLFESEDRLRDERWRAAGWQIHRFPTDLVYNEPDRFVAMLRTLLSAVGPGPA